MNEYKNNVSDDKESQMSQVEFPAFQEALVAYYGHLMSTVAGFTTACVSIKF